MTFFPIAPSDGYLHAFHIDSYDLRELVVYTMLIPDIILGYKLLKEYKTNTKL